MLMVFRKTLEGMTGFRSKRIHTVTVVYGPHEFRGPFSGSVGNLPR